MTITSMRFKTPPTVEPILFTDQVLQRHLRLVDNDTSEQAYIEWLITAARMKVEEDAGRALITQTWQFFLDRFPCVSASNPTSEIRIPKSPAQEIETGKFLYVSPATGLNTALVDGTDFDFDIYLTPARLLPHYGTSWPTARPPSGVTIEVICGYGDHGTDVPAPLKHAMLLLIGHWYENREAVTLGRIPSEVPMGYEALIQPYKVLEYA